MPYRLKVQIKENRYIIFFVSANVQFDAHFYSNIADNAKQWNCKRGKLFH